ncbi:MAG: hypothetical protein ABI548_11065 [Polyangiaceae bacterium]
MLATIASDQTGAAAIVVDDTSVYWASSAGISKAPLWRADAGTSTPTVLTTEGGAALALDANFLYFSVAASGKIEKVPLDGGDSVTLASGQSNRSFHPGYRSATTMARRTPSNAARGSEGCSTSIIEPLHDSPGQVFRHYERSSQGCQRAVSVIARVIFA